MRRLALLFVLLLIAGPLSAQAAPIAPLAEVTPCGGWPDSFLMTQNPRTTKLFGVVEDSGRTTDCEQALKRAEEVKDVGYNAVRLLVRWGPGLWTGVTRPEVLEPLRTLVEAYQSLGIHVIINISPDWNPDATNLHMPIGASDQRQFATFVASYAHLLPTVRFWQIGMEPNSSTFWRPQCRPGTVADAPVAFERLMALSYDALRSAEEDRKGQLSLVVIGPGLSSHGDDDPGQECSSHSPAEFFRDVGTALRKSERGEPIWDWVAIDPYGLTNIEAPNVSHSGGNIGWHDLDKLHDVLCLSFRGSAQSCNAPLFISEYGVETAVPPDLQPRYSGKERVQVVSNATHAEYNLWAIKTASCTSWIKGYMSFLMIDEPDRGGWQSGLFYAEAASGNDELLIAKPDTPLIMQMLFAAQDGAISCEKR
jgi:Fe-S cluster biogenesis protein NfuA